MNTQPNDRERTDQAQWKDMGVAALRQAVKECYCGLGPACPLWRQFTPEQRAACSLDKRAVAQAFWMNGLY
jgi:hypothetical protein